MRIMAGLDLARYFAAGYVIGGDGPFPRKPDPAGLLHLIGLAGSAPEHTTLVGDSAIDWQTARNASTRICLAAYGFGFDGVQTAQLGPRPCIVNTPEDLLREL